MRFEPYYGDAGNRWIGGLFGLLVVVAVVVGVLLVVRQFLERPHSLGAPPPPPPTNRAVEELDLRYARGEIDRDEYLQRRADLMHAAPPTAPPPA